MDTKERMLKGDPFTIRNDYYGDKVYYLSLDMGDPDEEGWSMDAVIRGEFGVWINRPIYNWISKRFKGCRIGLASLDDNELQFSFEGEIEQNFAFDHINFEGLEVFAEASKKDSFGIFGDD